MELLYKSTRNSERKVTSSRAILDGLAPDGGLYVPDHVPKLETHLDSLLSCSYQELAYEIMRLYLTDFTETELKDCIRRAYDSKFDTPEIAPLKKVGEVHYLELFHGATIAFKDMALSILPHLLTTAAKKNQVKNDIVILTATSGDTGKAALAGFADVPGTKIIVFYPKNGVSQIQELQMVTQKGSNVEVVALHGNFDCAQNGVKAMFEDPKMIQALDEHGYQFSSANSINVGRLVPQVVYYVWAYLQMVKEGGVTCGEPINIVVPTGNFGNILAAYYAKEMGLPVQRLICASNENKVLFDFFSTGTYDRNREFILTSSPSMDILISSNLERLIYEITGEDSDCTTKLMKELSETGSYSITPAMRGKLTDFVPGYATEEQMRAHIGEVFKETGYCLDTHTAVASRVYYDYRERTGDTTPAVVASTASPYKFVKSVMSSIDSRYAKEDELTLLREFPKLSGIPMPQAIKDILDARVTHDLECDPKDMEETVRKILKM